MFKLYRLIIIALLCTAAPAFGADDEKAEKEYSEKVKSFAEADAKLEGGARTKHLKERAAELKGKLKDAEAMELFRIERGFGTRKTIQKWPIVSQGKIESAEERKAILEFVCNSLHWNDYCQAVCFDPGYAIRIQSGKRTLELVLCFHCHRADVYEDGKAIGSITLLPVRMKDLLLETKLAAMDKKDDERWAKEEKENEKYDAKFAEREDGKPAKENKEKIAELVKTLAQVKSIELFAIVPPLDDGDNEGGPKLFRKYPILVESKVVTEDKRKDIISLLGKNLHWNDDRKGHCFKPRHALRFKLEKREIEAVICFECWITVFYEGEKRLGSFAMKRVPPKDNLLEQMLFGPKPTGKWGEGWGTGTWGEKQTEPKEKK